MERVSLEKNHNVQPRTVLGRDGEFEASCGLLGEPGFGFLRDVRGMIVEDDVEAVGSNGSRVRL